jgi:hypothetical protein
MLPAMGLVEQWRRIEAQLPEDWADARLELRVGDDVRCDRAAALLAPVNPGRLDHRVRFYAARRGAGPAPELVRRLLARLDEAGIEGTLELLGAGRTAEITPTLRETLAQQWTEALRGLPEDWSDLYCELELRSSDHLERAALLTAPLNPGRYGGTPGFRFRIARRFGYGASPEMLRRCLERLDENGIPGEFRVLWVLSDTEPVGTQGPVWYVGGKVV